MSTGPTVTTQLGYPCDKLPWAEDTDVYLDKVWFDDNVLPPVEWASCESCGSPLFLVSQLLAQLPRNKKADRVFYLFGCNRRSCMTCPGSWHAIKAIKSYEPKPKSKARTRKKGRKQHDGTPKATDQGDISSKAGQREENLNNNKEKGGSTSGLPTTPLKSFSESKAKKPAIAPSPPYTPKSAARSGNRTNTPTASNTWSLSPALSFGDSTAFSISWPQSPSFGAPSPAQQFQSLLAQRDKKYAWDEEVEQGEVELQAVSPAETTGPSSSSISAIIEATHIRAAQEDPHKELGREILASSREDTSVESGHVDDPVLSLTSRIKESLTIKDSKAVQELWSAAPTFPAYPLEFAPEPEELDAYEYEMQLLADYKRTERELNDGGDINDAAGVGWAGEGYEKVRPKYYNRSFKQFQKVVEEEPEQCIRYAFNGQPLFYNDDSIAASLHDGAPPCPRCSGPRAFEFQLMPMILSLLPTEQLVPKKPDHQSNKGKGAATDLSSFLERYAAGMDWGTVLVYSCARDCEESTDSSDISYSEEFVAVQVETLY